MASNHVGNPTEVLAPAAAPSLVDYTIQSIPQDGDDLDAASVAQALETPGNYIAYLQDVIRNMWFGDGSDGDLISPGYLGLSGYKFYDTVTFTGAVNVDTSGWPLIARTAITMSSGTTIRGNGRNAVTSTRGEYLLDDGPHGSIAPSNGLTSAQSYPYTGMAHYGLGGAGGAGGGAGTSGTQIVDPKAAYKKFPFVTCGGSKTVGTLFAGNANVYPGLQFDAIRGGGSGGSGEGDSTHAGGAGGSAGCLVVLIAPTITIDGAFQAVGGNGGAGSGGDANGGGGGGGGAFLFICERLIDNGTTYLVTGGTGGFGVGGGSAGSSGSDGNATPYVVYVRP